MDYLDLVVFAGDCVISRNVSQICRLLVSWWFVFEAVVIIRYIYNALNDALSAYRMHNQLKTILSKYRHIQNRLS